MRHVRLIPENDVRMLRSNPECYRVDTHPLYTRVLYLDKQRADGNHSCRSCGYKIERGERCWKLRYFWSEFGGKEVFLHAHECKWGEAHEKEPFDRTPHRSFPRKAQVERVKARAKPLSKKEREEQEEFAKRCGPIEVRFMNPLDMKRS